MIVLPSPRWCTFGNTIRCIPLCGNLPLASHTFGNTISCKHILRYRQLNTFWDTVSWTHLGIPSASHIWDTISCMPSLTVTVTVTVTVTKYPYTPRSVIKICEKYEVSSFHLQIPLILIETYSKLSRYTPLIMRQRGEKETMSIWAGAVEKNPRQSMSYSVWASCLSKIGP